MRTTMLIAAVLWAGLAQASAPVSPSALLTQAPARPAAAAASDDEDDEEAPAKPATPPATATDAPRAEEKPAAAAPAATPSAQTQQEQRLVSGAPLYNPHVAVHIVEQKTASDAGKRELILFPVAAQLNGKFTQHFGTFGSFVWHLQENFGLQITGGYNWYNAESAFNEELVERVRTEAQAATSLLWTWGVMGGVEVTPLYAKFAFFEGTLATFSVVLNGGAGAGGTRHQIKPATAKSDGTLSPPTFGETGVRFMGSIGAGFRLQIGQRFAFRLEVRDVVYTARVDAVNGCNIDDLKAMENAIKGGKEPNTATVRGGCDRDSYSGADESGLKRSINVSLAKNLVQPVNGLPSSDVLNNVGLYLGASFLF
jgi:outer membrane beta-barrel protein